LAADAGDGDGMSRRHLPACLQFMCLTTCRASRHRCS
jgi:hypothetical protein